MPVVVLAGSVTVFDALPESQATAAGRPTSPRLLENLQLEAFVTCAVTVISPPAEASAAGDAAKRETDGTGASVAALGATVTVLTRTDTPRAPVTASLNV